MTDETTTPSAGTIRVETTNEPGRSTENPASDLARRRTEHVEGLAVLRAHTESVKATIKNKTATGDDDAKRPL